jgi:hypothetical protein
MDPKDLADVKRRQAIKEHILPYATIEERLEGLTLEQRLAGLTLEQRLAGLTPKQVDELVAFARKLIARFIS